MELRATKPVDCPSSDETDDDEAGWEEALDEPEREPAAEPSPEEVAAKAAEGARRNLGGARSGLSPAAGSACRDGRTTTRAALPRGPVLTCGAGGRHCVAVWAHDATGATH
eukprot:COSAG01_NODE_4171_length_5273_cov_169.689602_5_plen_111_part_00